MIVLNTFFSEEETILYKWEGDTYEILSCIEGESYILNNVEGTYKYNECFKPLDKKCLHAKSMKKKYRIESLDYMTFI